VNSPQLPITSIRGRRRSFVGGSAAVPVFITIVLAAPVAAVVWSLRSPDREVWSLLARTNLLRMIVTTVGLASGVAVGATTIGVGLAWLVVTTRFPGRNVFRKLLVVPLALPAYVNAFVWTGLLQYAGPVQTAWRSWFGDDAWFPPVRTPVGAGLVLILSLYPYVYVASLTALQEHAASLCAAASTLGLRSAAILWRVAVPAIRPTLAAGAGLVAMETLTDVGVARIFSVSTLGDGVLRVWFGLDRQDAAAELASMLVGLVLVLVLIERATRGRRRYTARATAPFPAEPVVLSGVRSVGACIACASTFLFAAGIPLATLIAWSIRANRRGDEGALDTTYVRILQTSLELAGWTAVVCVIVGVLLALATQRDSWRSLSRTTLRFSRIASLGYAVPGLVVAAGVLTVLTWLDARFDSLASWDDRLYLPFLLAGSTAGVVYALAVRFAAVARDNIDAGLQRIDPRVEQVAATLGANQFRRRWIVTLPLLRSSIFVAALLVAIDALKELPATLLLRPPGRDTLAVFVWNMTNESRWEEASTPALTIVLLGLPLVLFVLGRATAPAGRRGRK
jgi:iron(III) transport system permease protein